MKSILCHTLSEQITVNQSASALEAGFENTTLHTVSSVFLAGVLLFLDAQAGSVTEGQKHTNTR